MKTDLGTGYTIEGFDIGQKSLLYDKILSLGGRQNVLYDGKTSEVPEETADIILKGIDTWDKKKCQCQERVTCYYCEEYLSKSEIERVCNQYYCIIYK